MAFSMRYVARGSIVDGSLAAAMPRMADEINREVGDHAVEEIRRRFDVVLQHPTGHLRSQVTATPMASGVRVTDGGVIYGPWIEGVSRRNRTTRFKGYRTFRLIAQQVRQDAPIIAELVVEQELARLK